MYGKVREDVREILKILCMYKKVEILSGAVCVDHVHLCLAIPPKLSVSEFMGYLKGKSSLMLFDKHPEMGGKWNREFWARGYYVSTVGEVNEAAVRNYIAKQADESYKEDRTVK
jgi:putative transposase